MELSDFLRNATRVVVCGIGNDIRGDDAVGVIMAERLRESLNNPKVVVLNCGEMPESYAGKIVRENPSHVLFVDAVHFGGRPGEVVLADPEGTLGEAMSTHGMPLRLLARYIRENTSAKLLLLGVQPAHTAMFAEMSPEVRDATEKLLAALEALLSAL
ncbi:hydrogenase 3 maturation endopeptidase HyCI [Palaeococcus ferrophilus]|uniref:hydrogenase 3 maturation endopeptidase HyCI n=1 Tax=Palaeococcus ferrophilus TaxID=83868 RepID=UPI00064FD027|nr:hydrogenase 3 maturation endopeptidase HyCI [Palaeococcus ferrophilus]